MTINGIKLENVNSDHCLPDGGLYVQATLVKETSITATSDSVTFVASVAINTSWYVPAGKQMVAVTSPYTEGEEERGGGGEGV